ncbi:unnamed protein product [Rhizophagus irregularis]|nr:unnamed protein product [Rhizophagus irregularis]
MTNILLNRIKTVKNVANVFKNQVLNEEIYYGTDYASEKENYQIAICQNGKFAVTFDTANLRIKILENTDHRPFTSSKKKVNSNNKNEFDGPEKLDEQDDINQIIAYFKINDDFMVEKFYEENYNPPSSGHDTTATENKASNLKWSFDISNVQEKNGESFIFVAISRIADEDMRRTSKEKRKDRKDDNKKPDYERKVLSKIRYNCPLPPDEAIAVDMQNTQPELTRVLTSRNNSEIKKGIAIYPSIRRELDSWYVDDDCMKRLLSCIYDKYFLVTQYKNNAQSLEVYDLEKMELETTAKKLENKDKFVKRYNYDTFSVSRLQLCFTRGVNNIRLYYIENGLQVAKKKLEVDRIHLLEFIENDEKLLVIGEGPKEGKDPEVTHACRALEHLNKRYKNKRLANNYTRAHKYEEIITYVKHIVWRFAKNEPENFRLLDVRRNIMKSLILGDCDYLIKFILFGDDEEINENKIGCKEKEKEKRQKEDEIRYIPCNKLWPGKTFLREDDLDFDEKIDKLEDNETIVPENIMELAIYHCKGRELNDTIMIAYLLEFYSRHATDCAGWMCTVSKAIPLLFKYNYDDYARKLFFKECFAVQDHFSAQEPDEIIPTEYLARRISFSIFLLWIDLILYLRLISNIGIYIYYVIIIFKTIFPFFLFMSIVIFAFAHTMFVLLRNPANIKTKESTYSGNATNVTTNETLYVELKSDFDPKSSDNPFSTFSDSLIAAYFWMGAYFL